MKYFKFFHTKFFKNTHGPNPKIRHKLVMYHKKSRLLGFITNNSVVTATLP